MFARPGADSRIAGVKDGYTGKHSLAVQEPGGMVPRRSVLADVLAESLKKVGDRPLHDAAEHFPLDAYMVWRSKHHPKRHAGLHNKVCNSGHAMRYNVYRPVMTTWHEIECAKLAFYHSIMLTALLTCQPTRKRLAFVNS